MIVSIVEKSVEEQDDDDDVDLGDGVVGDDLNGDESILFSGFVSPTIVNYCKKK